MILPIPAFLKLLDQPDLWNHQPCLLDIEGVVLRHLESISGRSAKGHWIKLRNTLIYDIPSGKTTLDQGADKVMALLRLQPASKQWKAWFLRFVALILIDEARVKRELAEDELKAAAAILDAVPHDLVALMA